MTDDAKIARILTRAAQMQQDREDEDRLAVVEEAAAEVGIDRALVRRAALEQSLDAVAPPGRLGIPTRVVRRRWIDADISNSKARAHLLARLDTIFGAKGERIEDDAHATWTARHVVVTFEAESGGTLVQISERLVNTANASMSLGGVVGLGAGASAAMFVVALLGKSLLAGLLAAPIVLLGIALGVHMGRVRVRTLAENADESFERALVALDSAARKTTTG